MSAANNIYGSALRALGERHSDVLVIDAGLATSMQTAEFRAAFPKRYVNLGIAEANAVGFASGLARRGFRPFVHSFANFIAHRAHDQIAMSVALPGLPVVFVAGSCGIYDGSNGPSHLGSDDIASVATLPGMSVYEPADAEDLNIALQHVATAMGPSYIRLRRNGLPRQLGSGTRGKPTRLVLEASEPRLTVVAIGSLLDEALTACRMACDDGLALDLIHVACLKPLELDSILSSSRKSGLTVVVENHVAAGGAGQTLATRLAEEGLRCRVFGLPDAWLPTGSPQFLLAALELDATSLATRFAALVDEEVSR